MTEEEVIAHVFEIVEKAGPQGISIRDILKRNNRILTVLAITHLLETERIEACRDKIGWRYMPLSSRVKVKE